MRPERGVPYRNNGLFGGAGEVLVWSLLGPEGFSPFTAVLACELAPGGSVGRHRQQECPEIVIVTEGRGEALVDGEPVELAPGAVVELALGQTLSIANGSADMPLRYLIVKAKAQ